MSVSPVVDDVTPAEQRSPTLNLDASYVTRADLALVAEAWPTITQEPRCGPLRVAASAADPA